jgi:hypothetical protein
MERLLVYRFKLFDPTRRRYVSTDKLATRAAIARMGWRAIAGSEVLVAAHLIDDSGISTVEARPAPVVRAVEQMMG